jgi:hypothetical protein
MCINELTSRSTSGQAPLCMNGQASMCMSWPTPLYTSWSTHLCPSLPTFLCTSDPPLLADPSVYEWTKLPGHSLCQFKGGGQYRIRLGREGAPILFYRGVGKVCGGSDFSA